MGEKQTSARASNSTRPMNAMFVRRRTPNRTKAPLANQKVPLILAPVHQPSMHIVCLNFPRPKAACGLRSNRQKINVFHPIHCLPPSSLFRQRGRGFSVEIWEEEGGIGRGGLLPPRLRVGARGAAAEQSFFNGDPFSEERPPSSVGDATYFRKGYGEFCVLDAGLGQLQRILCRSAP